MFAFQLEGEVQDAAVFSAFVWDHCHWGQFEVWGEIVLYISPSNRSGEAVLYFPGGFVEEALSCLGEACCWMCAVLECFHDLFSAPVWSTVDWAAMFGIRVKEWCGVVVAGESSWPHEAFARF